MKALGFIFYYTLITAANSFNTFHYGSMKLSHDRCNHGASSVILREVKESELINNEETFKNSGLFSWMQPYLKSFGFEEGKVLMNSIPLKKDTKLVSDEVVSERRRIASEKMMNIGPEEIQRREESGTAFLYASALYAFVSSVFIDQGDFLGHVVRFCIFPLFVTGYSFKLSAKYGLWNIAQAGLWDVDGNGLSKIEDPKLASAFLGKVNKFNIQVGIQSLILVLLFSIPPQENISNLMICFVLLATLYNLQGKIPQDEA